jgi:hypothetical protein
MRLCLLLLGSVLGRVSVVVGAFKAPSTRLNNARLLTSRHNSDTMATASAASAGQKRKGRAYAADRKKDARSLPMEKIGGEFSIHMVKDDSGKYVSCEPGADPPRGHMPDSAVARYARIVGFRMSRIDDDVMAAYPQVAASVANARAQSGTKDYATVCDRAAVFECFVLHVLPETEYGLFLFACLDLRKDRVEPEEEGGEVTFRSKEFMLPPEAVVVHFLTVMRELRGEASSHDDGTDGPTLLGRGLKFNTLIGHLSALNTLATACRSATSQNLCKYPGVLRAICPRALVCAPFY